MFKSFTAFFYGQLVDPIINSLMNKAYNFHKVHDEKIYVHVTSRIKKRSIDEL